MLFQKRIERAYKDMHEKNAERHKFQPDQEIYLEKHDGLAMFLAAMKVLFLPSLGALLLMCGLGYLLFGGFN